MRAREEAAAYAGRAWLEMSRSDRRRAVRLMRRIRANKAAKNERRLYTSREARETAEKCAYIYHTQANKKGKPE